LTPKEAKFQLREDLIFINSKLDLNCEAPPFEERVWKKWFKAVLAAAKTLLAVSSTKANVSTIKSIFNITRLDCEEISDECAKEICEIIVESLAVISEEVEKEAEEGNPFSFTQKDVKRQEDIKRKEKSAKGSDSLDFSMTKHRSAFRDVEDEPPSIAKSSSSSSSTGASKRKTGLLQAPTKERAKKLRGGTNDTMTEPEWTEFCEIESSSADSVDKLCSKALKLCDQFKAQQTSAPAHKLCRECTEKNGQHRTSCWKCGNAV